jgi:glucosylceramidase
MNTKKNYHTILLAITLPLFALINCKGEIESGPDGKTRPKLYITTLDQKLLLEEQPIEENSDALLDSTIKIDTTQVYQQIDGFGYTLTGGSALHIQKMSAETRQELLKELFGTDSNNIGVSYLRLSVGASDLDERPWSYNDLPDGETDMDLKKFSLSYDTLYLIPTIKEILKISPNIKLMGSPWSPPKWMKDNNDTRGGSLKQEYHDVYAQYLVKYI